MILTQCEPAEPNILWHTFHGNLCDDLERRIPNLFPHCQNPTQDDVFDYGLFLIQGLLIERDKTLEQYNLPLPVGHWQQELRSGSNRLIDEQRSYDIQLEAQHYIENEAKLNLQQRHVVRTVISAVEGGNGGVFFVQAAAGCGKTFVSNTLTHYFRREHKIVLCVASSGIASLLLIGGRTVHSRFKIPLVLTDVSCTIKKGSPEAALCQEAALIIWDEAPMQEHLISSSVDKTLQDIRESTKRFGGVVTVFLGDWRQTLPVKPKATQQEVVASSLLRSPFWHEVKLLQLTTNMRLESSERDQQFAQYLLGIGVGKHTTEAGEIMLPAAFKCGDTVQSLTNAVYPSLSALSAGSDNSAYFAERAILTSRNSEVAELNNTLLDQFPGSDKTYNSADSVVSEVVADHELEHLRGSYAPEVLASLNSSGVPLAVLKLKKGAPVMVLRNIDPRLGICNGSRGLIHQMTERVVQLRLLTGTSSGQLVLIPRMTLTSGPDDFPFTLQRRQFPLRLAFAMTINKSQGQSLKLVGIDLRSPVFSHGQLYVALSRCTSVQRIKVLFNVPTENDRECTANSTKTCNIVYKEALTPITSLDRSQ